MTRAAAIVAVLAMVSLPAAWAQAVISARSGMVNYVEGDVRLGGAAGEAQWRDFPGGQARPGSLHAGGARRNSADAGRVSAAGSKHVFPDDFQQIDRHAGGNPQRIGAGGSRRNPEKQPDRDENGRFTRRCCSKPVCITSMRMWGRSARSREKLKYRMRPIPPSSKAGARCWWIPHSSPTSSTRRNREANCTPGASSAMPAWRWPTSRPPEA